MDDIFKYIKKFGDKSFSEEPVNEVDIAIFSQLSYIDFSKVESCKHDVGLNLEDSWILAKEKNKNERSLAHKNAIKIISEVYNTNRYKEIVVSNFFYKTTDNTQFGAITLSGIDNYLYVVFEGTDDTIAGWKEDFALTYTYPTEAQVMAKNYLTNILKTHNKDAIILGHSKGGNLALAAALDVSLFKKMRIKKIYSLDGPGLKRSEFHSLKYKLIRKKLINIIPNRSIVGVLLEQENVEVVKSRALGLTQHLPTTWIVENKSFKRAKQDKLSIRFDESINNWLDKYNYDERKFIVESVFNLFLEADIKSLNDLKITKLDNLQRLFKESKDMSDETKEVIGNSFKLLASEFSSDILEDGKKFISGKLDEAENKLEKLLKSEKKGD